ncbi:MAG: amidohydrolase family protein [Planctomycetota bacterium]
MIIDCHCHAGRASGWRGPFDTSAPLGRYSKRARAAGIGRTVVFSVFHHDYAEGNRAVARIVAAAPDHLTGFAFVHAERDKGRIGALVREAVDTFGFRGIKVHRYDARITREVCKAALEHDIPILYDPMAEVDPLPLIAGEYPGVNFIIPHLGSFADDWRAQNAFIGTLARFDNVYTDTSGVRYFDLLIEALKAAGPGKILFGSDGPFLHPGLELAKVRALPLRGRDLGLVLGENARRLLRLGESRGPAVPKLELHGALVDP